MFKKYFINNLYKINNVIIDTIIKLFSFLPQRVLYFGQIFFACCQGKGYAQNINLEHAACLKLVKKRLETVLDIGAHHGIYTSKLMSKYPEAEYYLFEPCKTNVSFLKKKFRNNLNVKIFNYALSSKNKKKNFILTKKYFSFSVNCKKRLETS